MLILGILPSNEHCSQNLLVNCKLPLWFRALWLYCQGDEGTEHHWPWKKSGRYRRCRGAWSGNTSLCGILLWRPWTLNCLLLLVLCAASRVLIKVLNHENKDKNCCTFFFSTFAGSVCKSWLWNVVWGVTLEFGGWFIEQTLAEKPAYFHFCCWLWSEPHVPTCLFPECSWFRGYDTERSRGEFFPVWNQQWLMWDN